MDTIRNLFRFRTSEASRSTQTEAIKSIQPILTIHLPGYGSIRMIEPSPIENEPRQDYVLNGILEIYVPQPLGRLRCRSMKVGFHSVLTLRGIGQGPEEVDTLYDTEVQLRDLEDGGGYTYLEVGTQRFQFSIIIPGDIAPHDGFKSCPGRIKQDVYAEISGLEPAGSVPVPATHVTSRSHPTSPPGPSASLTTPDSITPHSPKAEFQRTVSSSSAGTLSIFDKPNPGATTLQDTIKTSRRVRVRYNPNRDGGFSKLEDISSAHVPGIGINQLQMTSDVFTIAAQVRFRCKLSGISSKTTIYHYQDHQYDGGLQDCGTGDSTSRAQARLAINQALWAGTDVGGSGIDTFGFDQIGRFPNDLHARPSTPPTVVSPIRTSHALVVQILVSVFGEDEAGRPLNPPGPGTLHLVRIARRIHLPHCTFIPSILDPPTYPNTSSSALFKNEKPNEQCPLCASRSYAGFCKTCPSDVEPHLKSVHDPQVCPHCGTTTFPLGSSLWHKCACGWDSPYEGDAERVRMSARMEETRQEVDPVDDKLRAEGRN